LLAEFPDKGWTKRSINRLFQKLRETGTVDRRVGSGRPRSARTEENIDLVDDLIVSQEDKPQTHRTVRKIAGETGIPPSSVVHVIKKDLRLKCFKRRLAHDLTDQNCAARLTRSRLLLKKFPKSAVDFIFFTASLANMRMTAPRDARKCQIATKRPLCCRPNFSKSLMVSVAVLKLGCSELFFVEPGVKVNGCYYRDMLLKQQMLPVMHRVAGDVFVFQQEHRHRSSSHLICGRPTATI